MWRYNGNVVLLLYIFSGMETSDILLIVVISVSSVAGFIFVMLLCAWCCRCCQRKKLDEDSERLSRSVRSMELDSDSLSDTRQLQKRSWEEKQSSNMPNIRWVYTLVTLHYPLSCNSLVHYSFLFYYFCPFSPCFCYVFAMTCTYVKEFNSQWLFILINWQLFWEIMS